MKTTSKTGSLVSVFAAVVWRQLAFASIINSSLYGRTATEEELEMLGKVVHGREKRLTEGIPAMKTSVEFSCGSGRSELIAGCCCS